MTNKRIVYTRHDGGVSICAPTDWVITVMGCGGFWDERPRGFMSAQINRMIEGGVRADVARRYARAMQFGGCTTAEALEIIRDRDCAPYGTTFELWDAADVPTDRWFRDAWKRSHNGGPIYVDLDKAKPIHFKRIAVAVEEENKNRKRDLKHCLSLINADLHALRERVLSASDVDALRGVWPAELSPTL